MLLTTVSITSNRAESLLHVRTFITSVVINPTLRPSNLLSGSGEDPKRAVRTTLESGSGSSSGRQETLDQNPLSQDAESRVPPEGSTRTSTKSMASCSDIYGHVHARESIPEIRNVGQSNASSPRNASNPQSEMGLREAGRKTIFAEFKMKSRSKNNNLVEYLQLPIPSKLHVRSQVAVKTKEISRPGVNNAERRSKLKEHCRPVSPPLGADSSPACTVSGPATRTLPQTRFSTLTSRTSRPYFLAPKNQEKDNSKSESRLAPKISASAILPVKTSNMKSAVFSPNDRKSDRSFSHENLTAGGNPHFVIFTDSTDSFLSPYLLPALT